MPAVLLLLPVALLAMGAVLAWAARRVAPGSGRLIAALAAWAALLALIAIWVPQRTPLDLTVGELGAGLRLAIRLDAVSFAFGLFVLVPAALLLTFTRSPSPPLVVLATAASLFTLEASGLILGAFGWGATLLLVAVLATHLAHSAYGAQRWLQVGRLPAIEPALLANAVLEITNGGSNFPAVGPEFHSRLKNNYDIRRVAQATLDFYKEVAGTAKAG